MGTPKSSILVGFSLINHPAIGYPIYGNPHVRFLIVISTQDFVFPVAESVRKNRFVFGEDALNFQNVGLFQGAIRTRLVIWGP